VVDDDPVQGAVRRTPRLVRRRRLGHAFVYGGSRATSHTRRRRGAGWIRLECRESRNV
jgi:hypothetical protein